MIRKVSTYNITLYKRHGIRRTWYPSELYGKMGCITHMSYWAVKPFHLLGRLFFLCADMVHAVLGAVAYARLPKHRYLRSDLDHMSHRRLVEVILR